MAAIDSLETLLVEELRDIYDAEKRLTKAIPKMAKAATNIELRAALESHLEETRGHVSRIEEAFKLLDQPAKSKPCAGMKGIIEEGDEHASDDYEDDGLRDAMIIGSAQRVEHYESAAYGTAIAHARLLGQDDVAGLLDESLVEEEGADQKLTEIAERVVNLEAAAIDDQRRGKSAARSTPRRSTSTTGRSKAADKGSAKSRRPRSRR